MGNRVTGRTRGGWANGRYGQSSHRPEPWWLGGRPPCTVEAQADAVVVSGTAVVGSSERAEVVVVVETTVISSRSAGQSRGGWADGCCGQ